MKNHPYFLKQEENCIIIKVCSIAFVAIAITITLLTNRCSTKKQLTTAMGNLYDVAVCATTTKTFKQTFSSSFGTFI